MTAARLDRVKVPTPLGTLRRPAATALLVACLNWATVATAAQGIAVQVWRRSLRYRWEDVDLSMELVANQAVSPGWMVSGSDQFRRTVAGGL